ncbi:hypothetical protein HY373_01260 [Candidatus Berkelbacteria bacterium]|nr:hypothetical protein [Candidatus Berkelbacteria bacterium]
MRKSTLVVGMALAILLGVFVLALPGCGGAGGSSGGPYYRFANDVDPNNIPVGVYLAIDLIDWIADPETWALTGDDIGTWWSEWPPDTRRAVIYTERSGQAIVSVTIHGGEDGNTIRHLNIRLRVVPANTEPRYKVWDGDASIEIDPNNVPVGTRLEIELIWCRADLSTWTLTGDNIGTWSYPPDEFYASISTVRPGSATVSVWVRGGEDDNIVRHFSIPLRVIPQ